ncbi:MAG: hypothetical protein JSW71_04250 [Gemmatimonadota bacterium]|nr:MAG: hypothetical protein JSW71_04250 [Gemmatimonadota bacterium]
MVRVNGTKTAERQRDVVVDPRYWQWIKRGVPSNLQYRWLNIYWKRACEAKKLKDLRMYDIRHLTGQIAGDFGVSDRDMTVHLGHSSVQMSHRYTRRAVSKRTAAAIAEALVQIEGQSG